MHFMSRYSTNFTDSYPPNVSTRAQVDRRLLVRFERPPAHADREADDSHPRDGMPGTDRSAPWTS